MLWKHGLSNQKPLPAKCLVISLIIKFLYHHWCSKMNINAFCSLFFPLFIFLHLCFYFFFIMEYFIYFLSVIASVQIRNDLWIDISFLRSNQSLDIHFCIMLICLLIFHIYGNLFIHEPSYVFNLPHVRIHLFIQSMCLFIWALIQPFFHLLHLFINCAFSELPTPIFGCYAGLCTYFFTIGFNLSYFCFVLEVEWLSGIREV